MRTSSGVPELEEEEVFEEKREGAEEGGGLLLAFGSGAVGLGHLEEGGVVGFVRRRWRRRRRASARAAV